MLRFSAVVDEVDKEVFDVEEAISPATACTRRGYISAAYLVDLVVLEDV